MAIKKVLVVDDSPTDAHVVTVMLEKNGFIVISAASGEESLEITKVIDPGAFDMDLKNFVLRELTMGQTAA